MKGRIIFVVICTTLVAAALQDWYMEEYGRDMIALGRDFSMVELWFECFILGLIVSFGCLLFAKIMSFFS